MQKGFKGTHEKTKPFASDSLEYYLILTFFPKLKKHCSSESFAKARKQATVPAAAAAVAAAPPAAGAQLAEETLGAGTCSDADAGGGAVGCSGAGAGPGSHTDEGCRAGEGTRADAEGNSVRACFSI